MTEQYVGPSALRIANLIAHRVNFERGWFCLDDDGHLSRRQVGRAGVQAEASLPRTPIRGRGH